MARSVLKMLLATGLGWSTVHAAESPKFQEVRDVIRANVTDVNEAELDTLAVQGLIGQLHGKVSLVTNQTDSASSGANGLLSRTNVFDNSFAYFRADTINPALAEQITANFNRLNGEKKIKGLVLDLRFAQGHDYPAAVTVLDQFVTDEKPQLALGGVPLRTNKKDKAISVPVTILVNHQTSGAAEALAALLRQNHVGLLIGATTAGDAYLAKDYPLTTGQTLRIANGVIRLGDSQALTAAGVKPDITVEVSAKNEKAYFNDPYLEVGKITGGTKTNTVAAATNAAPRRRLNEAELVRRQREGQNPDEDVATGKLKDLEPAKPLLQDPALARALDLLKGLAVVKQFRTP